MHLLKNQEFVQKNEALHFYIGCTNSELKKSFKSQYIGTNYKL